jgi:hypothetical protein
MGTSFSSTFCEDWRVASFAAEIGFERLDRGYDFAAHLGIYRIDEMRTLGGVEALRRILPALVGPSATRAGRAPARQNRLRHLEGRVTPAKLLPRALDLILAERRAVGCGGALLLWRAITDDGAAGDQRRPVGRGARIRDG